MRNCAAYKFSQFSSILDHVPKPIRMAWAKDFSENQRKLLSDLIVNWQEAKYPFHLNNQYKFALREECDLLINIIDIWKHFFYCAMTNQYDYMVPYFATYKTIPMSLKLNLCQLMTLVADPIILKMALDQIQQAGKNTHIDVNSEGDLGMTALHFACIRRNPEVVKILLDYGANCAEQDWAHKTPMDLFFPQGQPYTPNLSEDEKKIIDLLQTAQSNLLYHSYKSQ